MLVYVARPLSSFGGTARHDTNESDEKRKGDLRRAEIYRPRRDRPLYSVRYRVTRAYFFLSESLFPAFEVISRYLHGLPM